MFADKAKNKISEHRAQAIFIAGVVKSHLEYLKTRNLCLKYLQS